MGLRYICVCAMCVFESIYTLATSEHLIPAHCGLFGDVEALNFNKINISTGGMGIRINGIEMYD